MNSLGETMFNAQMTRIGVALHSRINGLVKEDKGAAAVEYGLIVGLIAVVIIGALIAVGTALDVKFDDIAGSLD
jgi:pilus assembly protein Flp/PilA